MKSINRKIGQVEISPISYATDEHQAGKAPFFKALPLPVPKIFPKSRLLGSLLGLNSSLLTHSSQNDNVWNIPLA